MAILCVHQYDGNIDAVPKSIMEHPDIELTDHPMVMGNNPDAPRIAKGVLCLVVEPDWPDLQPVKVGEWLVLTTEGVDVYHTLNDEQRAVFERQKSAPRESEMSDEANQWERVGRSLLRHPVPGGWLYVLRDCDDRDVMCFVAKPPAEVRIGTCADCHFSDGSIIRLCRVCAPVVCNGRADWPEVGDDDWCGQWTPRQGGK
ncbi:MAG: hypothetical protein EAZ99_19030 [Alphaproteobacteria bacterium]|nr:MAG: hypothetical protein EAZ99_19030 [Alphaproteobacteria bacterium]